MRSSLTTFVLLISAVVFAQCKKEPKDLYQRSCRPGMALASIDNWKDNGQNQLSFTITCVNVSPSCEEDCAWREECTEQGAYVRGIHPMFDKKCKCHRSGYLCCKPKQPIQNAKCPNKYTPLSNSKRKNGTAFIGGAKTTNNKITVNQCNLPKPVEKLCPIKETKSHETYQYKSGPDGLLVLVGAAFVLLIVIAAVGGGLILGAEAAKKRQGRSIFEECLPPQKAWCCGSQSGESCKFECAKRGDSARYIASYPGCVPSKFGSESQDSCCY